MNQEEKPIRVRAARSQEAPAPYLFRPDQWLQIANLGRADSSSEIRNDGLIVAGRHHRFSIAEYEALGETGIIPYDARVELINGEIIAMSPIGYRHAQATNRLTEFFNLQARGRFKVFSQSPIRLGEQEPQPDLVLIRPDAAFEARHPVAADVFLLIEVADSSLEFDREIKLAEYARHGVPEVWIVDLRAHLFESFRCPVGAAYAEKVLIPGGCTAAPEAFPDVHVPVSEMIP